MNNFHQLICAIFDKEADIVDIESSDLSSITIDKHDEDAARLATRIITRFFPRIGYMCNYGLPGDKAEQIFTAKFLDLARPVNMNLVITKTKEDIDLMNRLIDTDQDGDYDKGSRELYAAQSTLIDKVAKKLGIW